MTGLLLVPSTIFRSLAAGAILVALVSIAAALTLLPAVLSLLGDRVNALRVPYVGRSAGGESRFWLAVVDRVLRRPGLALALSAGLLILLALPAIGLKTGENGLSILPGPLPVEAGLPRVRALVRRGHDGHGAGRRRRRHSHAAGRRRGQPAGRAPRSNPALRRIDVQRHPDGRLAVIEALPVGDSRSNAAIATVKRLRSDTVPAALKGVAARGLVTGETAESVDYRT